MNLFPFPDSNASQSLPLSIMLIVSAQAGQIDEEISMVLNKIRCISLLIVWLIRPWMLYAEDAPSLAPGV